MKETTKLFLFLCIFAACWFLPLGSEIFISALHEALYLVKWYAREHVILCLVPAFFIAGAVGIFVSQGSVMKYLGPSASKWISYPVAASSGTILAVCSCTVLPLFAGIYKRGAGIGPATAFLYSGPAINVLAIILTARVLGFELGLVRALGSIVFAVVIGLAMHFLFRKSEESRAKNSKIALPPESNERRPWQIVTYFAAMLGVLIFANWGAPDAGTTGIWQTIYSAKWFITIGFAAVLLFAILKWFEKDELIDWTDASWEFAKQILPLLFIGVFVAGILLGGPQGGRGLIPQQWVASMVGGNSWGSNLFASVAGSMMYFATLTEVPILEGLLNSGMGKGPALALLLAGPALSLPNMLVIRSVLGTKQTSAYVILVVLLSTVAGWMYGVVAA